MLIGPSNVSKLLQNSQFPVFSLFWRHFCCHSNGKSQVNTRYLHWGEGGGGQNSLLTHVPLLKIIHHLPKIANLHHPSLLYVQHFLIVTIIGISTIKTKLNDYFASISTVNDSETQLPPFTKLTDNSLSQINCTELKTENITEVLNSNKASGDDGICHKMLKGVSKTVSKPLCILMDRSFEEGIFHDIRNSHF